MKFCTLLILFFGLNSHLFARNPHILVNADDKPAVLDKIKKHTWANAVFSGMQKSVAVYVERHQTDPQWILSRYLMNRVPGKRYTKFYSDAIGFNLIKYEGDAPVPTVRVATHPRGPLTGNGIPYKQPTIEELLPNDTCRLMQLLNPETGKKEWKDHNHTSPILIRK